MHKLIICAGLSAGLTGIAGCSDAPRQNDFNPDVSAKAFADSMQQLAEAIEKNDQAAVAAAVEALMNSPIDSKADSAEARQAIETYRTRVKGKLKGDYAAQVSGLVRPIEAKPK